MSGQCDYPVDPDLNARCGADCLSGEDVCAAHMEDPYAAADDYYDRERDETS